MDKVISRRPSAWCCGRKACVGLSSSSCRCASLWRSSGRCCSSAVWCGSGRPTHCTNSMSVRKLPGSLMFSSFFSFFHVKTNPACFLQVISPTRRCPRQEFCPGCRASSATPTTPASDTRPEERLRDPCLTTMTRCKPDRSPPPPPPRCPVLPYAEVGVGVLGWRGSTRMPKNSCSTRPGLDSSLASGTTCRPSQTSWIRYAVVRM